MSENMNGEPANFNVRNTISQINEDMKKIYIQELDDMYFHMQRKASEFWDDNRSVCPHCTENKDWEEEGRALEIEVLYMDYTQRDLKEESDKHLETVFEDSDIVFNLFNKFGDYNGGKSIGYKLLEDDELALQIHHATFVASKKDLTKYEKELISTLMYSCVVEAKKLIEEHFSIFMTFFNS